MLLVLDVPLALVVLAGLIPLLWVTRWFYVRSRRAYRGTRGAIAKIIVQFVETMNGMRAVQAFRREDRNEKIMAELNDRFRAANKDALIVVARFTMTVRLVGNLSLALVLAIGAVRVIDGGLELGVLTAFTLYLRRFYDPLDELAMFANSYTSAIAALEKISGVLEEEPTVVEPAAPVRCRHGTAGRAIDFDGGGVPLLADHPGGAADVRPAHPRRSDGRAGGRDRRGQVDARQAGRPLLRPVGRRGARWTACTCATWPTSRCATRS